MQQAESEYDYRILQILNQLEHEKTTSKYTAEKSKHKIEKQTVF